MGQPVGERRPVVEDVLVAGVTTRDRRGEGPVGMPPAKRRLLESGVVRCGGDLGIGLRPRLFGHCPRVCAHDGRPVRGRARGERGRIESGKGRRQVDDPAPSVRPTRSRPGPPWQARGVTRCTCGSRPRRSTVAPTSPVSISSPSCWGSPPSVVELVSGERSRMKRLRVRGVEVSNVRRVLDEAVARAETRPGSPRNARREPLTPRRRDGDPDDRVTSTPRSERCASPRCPTRSRSPDARPMLTDAKPTSSRRSIVARATKAVAKTRKAIGKVAGRPEREVAEAEHIVGATESPRHQTGAPRRVEETCRASITAGEDVGGEEGGEGVRRSAADRGQEGHPREDRRQEGSRRKGRRGQAAGRRRRPPVKTAPVKKGVPAKSREAAKKAPAKKRPCQAGGAAKGGAQAGRTASIDAPAKLPAERAPRRAPAEESSSRPAPAAARCRPVPRARGYTEERFLTHQRNVLERERATYLEQANSLQAEADLLVAEMEPGDIQFDEESGEGGTVAVDRERDLTLSAQALEAVEEIEAALAKIGSGRYGVCEGCGELIPKPRLEALPYAAACAWPARAEGSRGVDRRSGARPDGVHRSRRVWAVAVHRRPQSSPLDQTTKTVALRSAAERADPPRRAAVARARRSTRGSPSRSARADGSDHRWRGRPRWSSSGSHAPRRATRSRSGPGWSSAGRSGTSRTGSSVPTTARWSTSSISASGRRSTSPTSPSSAGRSLLVAAFWRRRGKRTDDAPDRTPAGDDDGDDRSRRRSTANGSTGRSPSSRVGRGARRARSSSPPGGVRSRGGPSRRATCASPPGTTLELEIGGRRRRPALEPAAAGQRAVHRRLRGRRRHRRGQAGRRRRPPGCGPPHRDVGGGARSRATRTSSRPPVRARATRRARGSSTASTRTRRGCSSWHGTPPPGGRWRRQLSARYDGARLRPTLVLGRLGADEGTVDAPIGRSVRDRTRMAVTRRRACRADPLPGALALLGAGERDAGRGDAGVGADAPDPRPPRGDRPPGGGRFWRYGGALGPGGARQRSGSRAAVPARREAAPRPPGDGRDAASGRSRCRTDLVAVLGRLS